MSRSARRRALRERAAARAAKGLPKRLDARPSLRQDAPTLSYLQIMKAMWSIRPAGDQTIASYCRARFVEGPSEKEQEQCSTTR